MTDIFYTFEYNGEIQDWECDTKDVAETGADDWWNEKHDGGGWANGETSKDTGHIIKFKYNHQGERVILERTEFALYFEYYHGDLKEHGMWG